MELGAVAAHRLVQCRQHLLAVLLSLHVDEVDKDDPADVTQRDLAHNLTHRLHVRPEDRAGQVRLADILAGVHVDDRQGLGAVHDDVAARLQPYLPPQRFLQLPLDSGVLKDGFGPPIELQARLQLGRERVQQVLHAVVLLWRVDQKATDLFGELIAHHPPDQAQVLVHQRRRAAAAGPLFHAIPHLQQELDVIGQFLLAGALRRRTDDDTHPFGSQLLGQLSQPFALLFALDAPAHPNVIHGGHQNQVVGRQGDVGRHPRALAAHRLFGHLDQDLLTHTQPFGNGALAKGLLDLFSGQPLRTDVADVQERISLQADVDERRLHPWEHVRNPALIDVAGQRFATLDEEVDQGPLVEHRHPGFVRLDVGNDFLGHMDSYS